MERVDEARPGGAHPGDPGRAHQPGPGQARHPRSRAGGPGHGRGRRPHRARHLPRRSRHHPAANRRPRGGPMHLRRVRRLPPCHRSGPGVQERGGRRACRHRQRFGGTGWRGRAGHVVSRRLHRRAARRTDRSADADGGAAHRTRRIRGPGAPAAPRRPGTQRGPAHRHRALPRPRRPSFRTHGRSGRRTRRRDRPGRLGVPGSRPRQLRKAKPGRPCWGRSGRAWEVPSGWSWGGRSG